MHRVGWVLIERFRQFLLLVKVARWQFVVNHCLQRRLQTLDRLLRALVDEQCIENLGRDALDQWHLVAAHRIQAFDCEVRLLVNALHFHARILFLQVQQVAVVDLFKLEQNLALANLARHNVGQLMRNVKDVLLGPRLWKAVRTQAWAAAPLQTSRCRARRERR